VIGRSTRLCHRISVSGFTTVRIRRQSISRDSATSAMRVASSARRGLIGARGTTPTACAETDSRRRVGRAADTSTTRIGGRRQRRAQSCARQAENGTLPRHRMLPSRTLLQIDHRHEGTLTIRFGGALECQELSRNSFGSTFCGSQPYRQDRVFSDHNTLFRNGDLGWHDRDRDMDHAHEQRWRQVESSARSAAY